MTITITPRNALERIARWLERLPEGARAIAVPEIAEEVADAMREYDSYQYVSRAQAYPNAPAGPGWFSDRQRRYVMAAIRSGTIQIPYQRTGILSASWRVSGTGAEAQVVSDAPAATYVMGAPGQSNHERLVGWRTTQQRIEDAQQRIITRARNAIRRAVYRITRNLED